MSTPSTDPHSTPAAHYRGDSRCLSNDSIGYLIKQVYLSLNRVIDKEMAPLELTAMQWRPLIMVALRRAETPAELARLIGVDTGAITRTLDRLESKGLLRRVRSSEDRRVIKLEMTEAGQATSERIPPLLASALNLHLRGFSNEEAAVLGGLLRRMIANGGELS
ncbi:MarR family winged helix-turn-helix transcriptional regulator [Orrella dioscoreae]|nr:MarR family transcriptional regulator [Orrella dioscoreae]